MLESGLSRVLAIAGIMTIVGMAATKVNAEESIAAIGKSPSPVNHENAVSTDNRPSAKPALKLPENLIRLPLTRQATCYTCGVSALQSVLAYYGKEFREDSLSKQLKANYHDGTAYLRIVRFAAKLGFKVDVHKDMNLPELKALIDRKQPVICLLQAWSEKPRDYTDVWSDGHYVVACGYDDENIFFMDPSTLGNFAYIPESEFVDRWHDTDGREKLRHFGMVVSKDKSTYCPDVATYME